MSVLYIALPAALFLGALGLIGCFYCIKSGQYDDLDSESMRILNDDSELKSETRK
ncbi:cbb3-type cytochrome oxidase assembly protein CcoS [Pirellulaceae bacterium SH449]